MTSTETRGGHRTAVLKQLAEGLLEATRRPGVHGNVLEIHHPAATPLDPAVLHSVSAPLGLSISLCQDAGFSAGQCVRCDSGQLPFQDRVFGVVILHHVVGGGDEAELSEAVRVLARTGVLVLVGLNRAGWRFRTQDSIRRLPGMSPFRIRSRLTSLGMTMDGFAGAGLCGQSRPAFMASGLKSLAVPVADVVLLRAKHSSGPAVTPLRLRKTRSAVVQSAPLRG